jgi:hypothetical protein
LVFPSSPFFLISRRPPRSRFRPSFIGWPVIFAFRVLAYGSVKASSSETRQKKYRLSVGARLQRGTANWCDPTVGALRCLVSSLSPSSLCIIAKARVDECQCKVRLVF